ncbi:MAG: hypothetical protein OJF55_000991 [Rhodanobacteraceae bacterium]|nr:MAG: hypothetical protein OJF55_000991 [Rhodanobacteraceae bacterium]
MGHGCKLRCGNPLRWHEMRGRRRRRWRDRFRGWASAGPAATTFSRRTPVPVHHDGCGSACGFAGDARRGRFCLRKACKVYRRTLARATSGAAFCSGCGDRG